MSNPRPTIVLTHTPEELPVLFGLEPLARLRELGEVIVNPQPRHLTPTELLALAPEAEFVVSEWKTGLDRAYLTRADRLRAFIRCGVEILNVDFAAATERGVLVVNTPGLYTTPVVELIVGAMVNLARDVIAQHNGLRAGARPARPPRFELAGQTLGIVGLGQIGRHLASVAGGLGMQVIASDPYVSQAPEGVELVDLETLLRRARFVSLHALLTPETRRLIGSHELALMRPDAYLINTARGPLVDEAALAEALRRGRIAGAAVDVFASEPDFLASPLISAPNVQLTPHIGGYSAETMRRQALAALEAISVVLAGGVPGGVVNRAVLRG